MIHNVILALCIGAALAALFAALWTMLGNKVTPHAGVFSVYGFSHPFDQYLRRRSEEIVLTTSSERSLPGGWSLIQRTMRARRDIRIGAR